VEQVAQPLGEPFSAWPEYIAEAEAIIAAAAERGLHLRLLGALAVIKQCPGGIWLLEKTNRVLTDLDFMGYDKEIGKIETMFGELGYEVLGGRGVTMDVWVGRRIFHDPSGGRRRVDVFLDKLDFCHPIELKGRLDLDPVTIPLTDILLEKLQIVEINEKDIVDTIMLLLEHPLGDDDGETVNIARVAHVCARDWGWWRTLTMNLDKVRRMAVAYPQLTDDDKARVSGQVGAALARIDAEPKSMAWRMRARIGDRKKWYRDVSELAPVMEER